VKKKKKKKNKTAVEMSKKTKRKKEERENEHELSNTRQKTIEGDHLSHFFFCFVFSAKSSPKQARAGQFSLFRLFGIFVRANKNRKPQQSEEKRKEKMPPKYEKPTRGTFHWFFLRFLRYELSTGLFVLVGWERTVFRMNRFFSFF
jgi:hypothetical protein